MIREIVGFSVHLDGGELKRCPGVELLEFQSVHVGGQFVQVGVCSGCGAVLARRFTVTGPGTGYWTVLGDSEDGEV